MSRFFQFLLALITTIFTLLLVVNPLPAMEMAGESLSLCYRIIIPSLFPFFVFSRLLIDFGITQQCSRLLSPRTRSLFGVPGSGAAAIILGILSGYPIGAATAVRLYQHGSCTKTEAERLLTFCNNAGPMFILGSVGIGMLHNKQLGVLLYVSHLLSALITGFLFRNHGENYAFSKALPPAEKPNINPAFSLANAINDALNNVLKVCGFVIFFSVVCKLLPWKPPLLHSLLEMTGGLSALIDQSTNIPLLLPVISFLLALSGLSILLQTAGIVLPTGLSMKPVLFGKFTQAIISFLLTWLACNFLPVPHPAFAKPVSQPPLPTISQLLAFVSLEFGVALLSIGLLCLLGFLLPLLQRKK